MRGLRTSLSLFGKMVLLFQRCLITTTTTTTRTTRTSSSFWVSALAAAPRPPHHTHKRAISSSASKASSFNTNHNRNNNNQLSNHHLLDPTILYSDNHLLVVHKPPGWHSVPNAQASSKCLLTELQRRQWGGGSQRDFLKPLHRLDQPCSGVLLYAKTSKAATRISKLWKQGSVDKDYLIVVPSDRIPPLKQASRKLQQKDQKDGYWHYLEGSMERRKDNSPKSQTVRIHRVDPERHTSTTSYRHVSLHWKILVEKCQLPQYTVLQVQTNEGARHMVRALMALVGQCPIVGDARYAAKSLSQQQLLPDRSVALHAVTVQWEPSALQLGTLEQHQFQAAPPATWGHYFGLVMPSSSTSSSRKQKQSKRRRSGGGGHQNKQQQQTKRSIGPRSSSSSARRSSQKRQYDNQS